MLDRGMPDHIHGTIVIQARAKHPPWVSAHLENGQNRMLRPYSRVRPGICHQPHSGDHKDRLCGTAAGSVGTWRSSPSLFAALPPQLYNRITVGRVT